jgi:hypothetical protein
MPTSSSVMLAGTLANRGVLGTRVPLAGVGQHAEDVGALGCVLGDSQGAGEGSARCDADEDALLGRELLAGGRASAPVTGRIP